MSINGIDFVCTVCHKPFVIDCENYHGEFDHPPSEPVCPDCDHPCDTCDGGGRVEVRSQDPQDDYEVPCPECNADGDGFSKSELANIDRIRRQNAKHWRNTWGDEDRGDWLYEQRKDREALR
jgi:hypothetical protein